MCNIARRADGARGADRALPAPASKGRHHRPELEPHGQPRALEALRAELAVVEMRTADAHAADVQALELLGLMTFADDELRAAAADVDDEIRAVRRVRVMRNPEVDEARLFDTGDDLDGMSERLFSFREELVGVLRAPQGVRAYDAHLMRLHVTQPLTEPPQTRERPLLARVVEKAV